MRSLRLSSGMALGLLLAIGCHDSTGLHTVPDAGRNGGAGGVAAGTGGGPAGTGGGAGASATGGSGAGGSVGTDAAANPDTNARADAGGDVRDGTGGTTDATSLPGSGGNTDIHDATGDTLPGSRWDGGPDAANDQSLIDVGAPDAKDAPAGEAKGPVDSGTTESGGLDAGSVCSEVPCLAAIFLPCQPTLPCTSEQSGTIDTGETTSTCYANGVKQQSVYQLVGEDLSATFTEKRETGVCFTIEVSFSFTSTSSPALYVFRDGAGNQVATGTAALNTDVVIVTCNGGTPTPVSQACLDTASTSSACTAGPCTN